MLNLPKFTFLCNPHSGAQTLANALADAIIDQDEDIVANDFEEPLRDSTQELFFGGYRNGLPNPPPLNTKLFHDAPYTIEDWYTTLREGLSRFSEDALGRIAYSSWVRNGESEVFRRFIYRDARSRWEIIPFAQSFPHECLAIHLDSMPWVFPAGIQVKHVVLTKPDDLANSLLQLERELG